MHVLVAEDDPKIAKFIAEGLRADGHQVEAVDDGVVALKRALEGDHELLILDLGLPGLDGLELLRRLRQSHSGIRVIVVSARSKVEQLVQGLDMGADDYLPKPFSFIELQARIRAQFRRSGDSAGRTLSVGALALDRVSRTARLGEDGKSVELSAREFQLLEHFMRNVGEPQSRAMLADRVWGYQFDTGTNVVDVYVNYLRKKLRELELEPLKTLRGIGYVFERERCAASEGPGAPHAD